jgi:hypothetical protein
MKSGTAFIKRAHSGGLGRLGIGGSRSLLSEAGNASREKDGEEPWSGDAQYLMGRRCKFHFQFTSNFPGFAAAKYRRIPVDSAENAVSVRNEAGRNLPVSCGESNRPWKNVRSIGFQFND